MPKIKGTALFFSTSAKEIPTYVYRTVFYHNIVYEDNVIVTVSALPEATGADWRIEADSAAGLRFLTIRHGYMEPVDLAQILVEVGIQEKTIFYGQEEILSRNIVWKAYSLIKRQAPSIVEYYQLPYHKFHGVITRVEL